LPKHLERFKFLQHQYDEERDNNFDEANFDFKNNYINEEKLKERMQEIKWDIAWNLYDEVNEDITPFKPSNIPVDIVEEIDLHCLDIDEAKAITK